jgi:hypothetical protein
MSLPSYKKPVTPDGGGEPVGPSYRGFDPRSQVSPDQSSRIPDWTYLIGTMIRDVLIAEPGSRFFQQKDIPLFSDRRKFPETPFLFRKRVSIRGSADPWASPPGSTRRSSAIAIPGSLSACLSAPASHFSSGTSEHVYSSCKLFLFLEVADWLYDYILGASSDHDRDAAF